jgi:outer membrane protein assembly factor BamB
MLVVRFLVPAVAPDTVIFTLFGWLVGALLIVLWWLFFSRAPWAERLTGLGLMVVAVLVTRPLLHESVATAGQGVLFFFFALPVLSLALVAWAVATRHLSTGRRRVTMVATILLAGGAWALVRTGGITNSVESDWAWRWSAPPEERLLTDPAFESLTPLEAAGPGAEAEWPGFRGPNRDGIVTGVEIETDWSASPPVELWRRPVGPGWSSFAVHADAVYTQEQRGEEEVVSAYRLSTGEPVWRHGDPTRFWESNAGAGPRATPTLSGGRVYTFGATGLLNALDASDGSALWSRDVGQDADIEVPGWGFASSPLVVGDVVIVAAAGKLAAYDIETGEPRWFGPDGGDGYSSPHLIERDGVAEVLLASLSGIVSMAPADGAVLWSHDWGGGSRIVQPASTEDGDLLVSRGETTGMRRIAILGGPDERSVEERWTSNRLKPFFSDFVIHEGHAYGFDGNIMASIDVETGERTWKGGRYGAGQLVLLADQDVLLVVSEKGGLALVSATPDGFSELARFEAVEGKTWNHPVVVGDLLLVRNGEEMVAFRLALAGG